jgi:hypothetical protein
MPQQLGDRIDERDPGALLQRGVACGLRAAGGGGYSSRKVFTSAANSAGYWKREAWPASG